MRNMRKLIVIAAMLGAQAALAQPDKQAAKQATDALELFHIENRVFDVVRCRSGDFDGLVFIRCHPVPDGIPGNLWVLEDGPTLMALNGKALAQLDRMGTTISDVDGRPIAVSDWRKHHSSEPMPDISGALSALGYQQ